MKLALKEMLNPPNLLQLSVASCAVQLIDKYPKLFLAWIGGQGKSRILATIALIVLATSNRFKKVRFVFPNKLLQDKDHSDFADLWKLLPCDVRVNYSNTLKFATSSDELYLIDEGDYFMFK